MKLYSNPFIENLMSSPPDHVILVDRDWHITSRELFNRAIDIAVWLTQHNVKVEDRIVIVIQPGRDFVAIMYACMMLRLTVSIIDPEMGTENYQKKLKQFAPQFAFVDSRLLFLNEHPVLNYIIRLFKKKLPTFHRDVNCKIISVGYKLPLTRKYIHLPTKLPANNTQIDFEKIDLSSDFLVIYTSGTLHKPKGVVHTYKSLSASMNHLTALLQNNKDHRIATHLPHFILLGINAGIEVYIWDNDASPVAKMDFIHSNGISSLFGPPVDFVPLIDHCYKINAILPGCLKNIYFGSAPVYPSFLMKMTKVSPHIKLTCLYGMTENLMVAHIDAQEKLEYAGAGDIVGYPFEGVNIKVSDDNELLIDSDQLFEKYWGQECSSKQHQSGDLGSIDDLGRIVLLGRKKDMIIRGNFNVYPGLYEPTINKIKGINEAVMIGIYNHDSSDETIVLVVDGAPYLSQDSILKELNSGRYSIDKQAIPDKIIFMKIPHSGRQNKVDKKRLRQELSKLYQ